MTDLELTRLCAEAMGLIVQHSTGDSVWRLPYHNKINDPRMSNVSHLEPYNPLHDGAQAMALFKKFITRCGKRETSYWWVEDAFGNAGGMSDDLNRTIVECVAKMQAAK